MNGLRHSRKATTKTSKNDLTHHSGILFIRITSIHVHLYEIVLSVRSDRIYLSECELIRIVSIVTDERNSVLHLLSLKNN